MHRWLIVAYILLTTYMYVESYKHYQQNVPNGERVPHPCKPNYIWHGVGHKKSGGGGARNPFGIDFASASHVWNQAICQMDSDGDGMTNGQELGDPNCRWKKGDLPERTINITHPGVCDPVNSPSCKTHNAFVNCDPENDFRCDAINETATKNITVRFPMTAVPSTETNYYCMVFDLPQDGDYHLIATTPHIDNDYVMHHLALFGCDESYGPVTTPLITPQKCTMGDTKCNSIIGLWAVGTHGECLHEDIGIRFGAKNGYKKAMFQIHWNNPERKSDYTDSSGMNLFYTPVLRKYDAGVMLTGQHYLKIPPRQERVVQTGSCSPECTRIQITKSINITRAFNHMHYLGREMKIELFRNGNKVRDITNDPTYNYDNPVTFNFDTAIEVLPGDEIKTTCVFSSKYKTKTTFYGDGSQDEMCYGFLTYHPQQNMPLSTCSSWKKFPTCKIWYYTERFPVIDGCNWLDIFNTSHPAALIDDVMDNCRPYEDCLPECLEKMKTLKDHPCLNNDIGDLIRDRINQMYSPKMMRFIAAMDSCKLELNQMKTCAADGNTEVNSASPITLSIAICILNFLWSFLFLI